MRFRPFAIGCLTGLVGVIITGPVTYGQESPRPDELVDVLNNRFGEHRGTRAAHAKGICLTGKFTPSPDAPSLSKAPHFAAPVDIIARFSIGGGDPAASDHNPLGVHGLAVRFDLGNGSNSDLLMISAPVFFAKTPALAAEFIEISADKDRRGAFLEAHPESKRQIQWLLTHPKPTHPVPASYAEVNYFGVHAFTLTNAEGDSRLVKYKAMPEGGKRGLTREAAEAKGPNFYAPELEERLAKGSTVFNLVAILGQPGDPTNDPTLRWEDEDSRATAPLGKIVIEEIAPDATCNAFSFLPANLPDGIAGPNEDPVFAIRSPAYAVSLTRRLQP